MRAASDRGYTVSMNNCADIHMGSVIIIIEVYVDKVCFNNFQ